MSTMYSLVLALILMTSLPRVSLARRPQIAVEELFQKSTVLELCERYTVQSTHSEAGANRAGKQSARLKGAQVPAAVSSCYFNRDCQAHETCVKPEGSGALTTGVCSLLLSDVKPAPASEHSRDLHFVVRNRVRRSAATAASERRRTNALLRKLLGEGSQLSRALNAYVHAKYPTEWESLNSASWQDRKDKSGKTYGPAAVENSDSRGGTAESDLLAILDVAHNRLLESASRYEMPNASAGGKTVPEDGGPHGPASKLPTPDKRGGAVVDVKEDDMASGPKRRRMTEPTNYLE